MTLSDILASKGSQVYTIVASETLRHVTEILVERDCGSLVVVESEGSRRMVGIITERDILRACSRRTPLDETKVEDVMTRDIVTSDVNDTLEDSMDLVTERRVRHLPIVKDGQLAGMVSIGDLVKAHMHLLHAENHHLKNYIQS